MANQSRNTAILALLINMLFVTGVGADDSPGNASRNLFRTLPGWIAETHPLTAVERTFPDKKRPKKPASQAPSDGTWRDEGGYVIIKLGGREYRLRKASSQNRSQQIPDSSVRPASRSVALTRSTRETGGTVFGRLLNRRRPLVNCRVSLIPLRRTSNGYVIDGESRPQTIRTDGRGDYRFENVPRGPYKLYWLPVGQRRWIRRLEFKPDAVVRNAETTRVKTIRVALRTLN